MMMRNENRVIYIYWLVNDIDVFLMLFLLVRMIVRAEKELDEEKQNQRKVFRLFISRTIFEIDFRNLRQRKNLVDEITMLFNRISPE